MASNTVRIKKPQNVLVRPFLAFLHRFHLMIFFIFIIGCLSAAIILINKTLTERPSEVYTSPISAGTIDRATLERIQTLQSSSQPGQTPPLPEGRINPFAE